MKIEALKLTLETVERLAKETRPLTPLVNPWDKPPEPAATEPARPKVKDETMRRLRKAREFQQRCALNASAAATDYVAMFADTGADNFTLSDLDEILEALDQRQ
jgi:hypothetical protein